MRTSPARGGAFFFVLGFLLLSRSWTGPHPVHRLLLPGAGEALRPPYMDAGLLSWQALSVSAMPQLVQRAQIFLREPGPALPVTIRPQIARQAGALFYLDVVSVGRPWPKRLR